MTNAGRVRNILFALIQTAAAVYMIAEPADGYVFVAVILSFSLLLMGVKTIIYYFSMARHMVGGKRMLYIGVLLLDAGAFAVSLDSIPRAVVLMYLFISHAFSGVIDVLRVKEAKDSGYPFSKFTFATGIINLVSAALCIVFINSERTAVYIFCAGIIYSAITRIISSFRETRIIFIS